jgi:ubiquinone/menaquinone biosynthesis C-methylase UbiE
VNDIDVIIDLYRRNDRQGPGSSVHTRLDVGCGTGASALVVVSETDAIVTAIDSSSVFVKTLRERAESAGLASRIRPMVGHMAALPFDDLAVVRRVGAC